MKAAETVGYVGGIPIWKFLWGKEQKEFLVRINGKDEYGSKNYIVKSPSGQLYEFHNHAGTEEELFAQIDAGQVEDYEHMSPLESIYDEFTK